MVEAQCRHVDDGDVEGLEAGAGGAGDPVQALAHQVSGVLGGEHQDRAGPGGGEVAQARDAGGDGDGEVHRQDGFAALGLAADDADGLFAPQRVDQPLPLARPVLQLDRGAGREAVRRHAPAAGAGHGASSSSACWRCSAVTVLAPSRAAADSA